MTLATRIMCFRMAMSASSAAMSGAVPTADGIIRSPDRNNNNTDFSSRVSSDEITIIMTSYVYYSYETIRELIYFEK